MPSMHEVIVQPEVDFKKEITLAFLNSRSSGTSVVVKSVLSNGFFDNAGIVVNDELMSMGSMEAHKFKDIEGMLTAFENIRYPSVKCVFFRQKESSLKPKTQVNKSPVKVPEVAWTDVNKLDLRSSNGNTGAAAAQKIGPNGKWLPTTTSQSMAIKSSTSPTSSIGNNNGTSLKQNDVSATHGLKSTAPSQQQQQQQGKDAYVEARFVDDLHKQPCKACDAPWMEQSGFLVDGKHSRCCRNCGISYCSDCKYTHMIKTKGSGTLDMSNHMPPPPEGNSLVSPSPPPYRRHTFNEQRLSQALSSGSMSFKEGDELNRSTHKSQWLCRGCAEECGVSAGKPCSVCNAPWTDKSSFLGANSQHSRECKTCHKSFCYQCKKTNMEAIKSSFTGRPDKPRVGVFASFSSKLSFSVKDDEEYEPSARAPLHQYECLTCRAEHMYQPMISSEGANALGNKKKNLRRASAPAAEVRHLSKAKAQQKKTQTNQIKDWMKVIQIDAVVGEKLGIDMSKELLITRVFPDSLAAKAGLQVGWALLQVNEETVINLPTAQRAISAVLAKGNPFNLVVSTTGR